MFPIVPVNKRRVGVTFKTSQKFKDKIYGYFEEKSKDPECGPEMIYYALDLYLDRKKSVQKTVNEMIKKMKSLGVRNDPASLEKIQSYTVPMKSETEFDKIQEYLNTPEAEKLTIGQKSNILYSWLNLGDVKDVVRKFNKSYGGTNCPPEAKPKCSFPEGSEMYNLFFGKESEVPVAKGGSKYFDNLPQDSALYSMAPISIAGMVESCTKKNG
jgi:hypothetical protein